MRKNPNHALSVVEQRVGSLIEGKGTFLVLVAGLWVARWLLADWNSYWLDELLSVDRFGHWNETGAEVVRRLAEESVHPPLYQLSLFYWMQMFGITETATRSLSNLYIAGATLSLYGFVNSFASRRVSFASVLIFSLMNTPTYFALETRSYAQSLFLVCLSSYLLVRSIKRLACVNWGRYASIVTLLALTNAALLLTHYYNAFFVAVQGLFVLVYALRNHRRGRLIARFGCLMGSFVVSALLFGISWAPVFIATFRERSSAFALEGDPENPLGLVMDTIVRPNLSAPSIALGLLAVAVAWVAIRDVAKVARKHGLVWSSWRAWWRLYLIAWLWGPPLVATTVFLATGVARYNSRYFVFCMPALAPLIATTIWEAVRAIRYRSASLLGLTRRASYSLLIVAIAVLWVAPGAHAAATFRKHDWRGLVSDVVNVVESDPESSYVIVEAASRDTPTSNHYFARLDGGIRAEYVLTKAEEAKGAYRILGDQQNEIEQHDMLIVMFPHSRTEVGYFPSALARLSEQYREVVRQLRFGRGYIVFDLRRSEIASAP